MKSDNTTPQSSQVLGQEMRNALELHAPHMVETFNEEIREAAMAFLTGQLEDLDKDDE